ncbi:MAG: energy-coupling factor transporter transmembrane component T [Candidatus Limnocylindrales bacterium]
MTETRTAAPSPVPDAAADRWRALDPSTRLAAAVATLVAALVLGGPACPLVLLVLAVLVPAAIAQELAMVVRLSLLLSLPLGVSVVLVNLLFSPGTLADGAWLAAEVVVRVVTMAGAAVLFYRTTSPADLVGSLQHHGLSPRLTFVVHNAVAMIPRLAERAHEVAQAQRARGLDSEGSWLRRGRGLLAVSAPTVLGAIGEVETRTLALETRGFTRPGRPTVLRVPRDSGAQRVARWGLAAGVLALGIARVVGVLPC